MAATKRAPKPKELDKALPEESELAKVMPEEDQKIIDPPDVNTNEKEMPDDFNRENSVYIGKRWVEIKPTLLKYFRNRTAAIYSVLKIVPINEFLAYDKGTFDKERDSDQILFDFLCAVFNDAAFVTRYYNDMSADDIEKILKIFGRVNHINEKEEEAKNRAAQMKH